MKKYWIYLKPFCFVWKKGGIVLLYNSLSGKGKEIKSNNTIDWLIDQLLDLNNLYCIEVTEDHLHNNELSSFISEIKDSDMGNIIPYIPQKRRPVFLVPVLNLQQDINKLRKESERSLGKDIMKNLHEISFFINLNEIFYGCCINCFNQSVYRDCVNKGELRFSEIKIFLEQIGGSSVSAINIYADNILKYAELEQLVDELDKMHIIKTFCFPLRSFPANIDELKFLGSPQFRLKILVDPGFDSQKLDRIFQKLRISGIQCEWSFFVSSKEEFKKVNSVISESDFENTEIKPFLNGKNIKFFQDNIYLTKGDLLNSNLTKREIFAHQVLNTNDFGKLTVLPDRKVYANVNHPPLGLINEPVNKMVFNEMDKGTSWRRIRDMEPCCDCVYQWLCPSPSNYELAIGKPNLCHIK